MGFFDDVGDFFTQTIPSAAKSTIGFLGDNVVNPVVDNVINPVFNNVVKPVVNTVHDDITGITNFAGDQVKRVVDTGANLANSFTNPLNLLILGGGAIVVLMILSKSKA